MLASWYAYAAASNPNEVPYDFSFWRTMGSVAGTALGAWFTHRRSKAAIPVATATAVCTMAAGFFNKHIKNSYVTRSWNKKSWKEKAFNRAMPAVHAIGSAVLAGSALHSAIKRKREKLTPLSGPLLAAPWYPLARKLGLYFMSFSMLGHWAEMLFCTGIKHGIFKGGYDRENHMLWDQWLFPFPAEGTAAVLADLVLTPIKQLSLGFAESKNAAGRIPTALVGPVALGLSFLANQVVCTAIDFSTGMVANRNYQLWDYRDMRFHFMGQVCLQNSLFYSLVATWGVWHLLPLLEDIMQRAGDTALDGALVGAGSVFAFLELLYQVVPKNT